MRIQVSTYTLRKIRVRSGLNSPLDQWSDKLVIPKYTIGKPMFPIPVYLGLSSVWVFSKPLKQRGVLTLLQYLESPVSLCSLVSAVLLR